MTVVADTSPLNYLCLLGEIELLQHLFERVLIPPAVLAELSHPRAPQSVMDWARSLPKWATVKAPIRIQTGMALDPGETEAISLVLDLGLEALLIDERAGRRAASEHGITVIGTLALLTAAAARNLLDLEHALHRLEGTSFHLEPGMIQTLLARSRRSQPGH